MFFSLYNEMEKKDILIAGVCCWPLWDLYTNSFFCSYLRVHLFFVLFFNFSPQNIKKHQIASFVNYNASLLDPLYRGQEYSLLNKVL